MYYVLWKCLEIQVIFLMAGSSVSLFMQNRINHKFEISLKVTVLHMYIKQSHTQEMKCFYSRRISSKSHFS